MGRGHKPSLPLGHLLFVTWAVAGGGMATGLAPALAIPVALALTLLLLHFADRPGRILRPRTHGFARPGADDPGARGPLPLPIASVGLSWSGGYLPKLRELRRRGRAKAGSRTAGRSPWGVNRDPASDWTRLPWGKGRGRKGKGRGRGPALVPILEEDEPGRGDDPALDPRPGVLLALALLASSLTVLALISEAARRVQDDGRLDVARLVVLCGVVVLPFVIGIASRCELHSILTMVGLSAAVQTILFQATPFVPDALFLGMAAITLVGIPPALAWLFSRIDRRSGGESIETTAGRLLESKQDRMSIRLRARPGDRSPDASADARPPGFAEGGPVPP
jgi:hypothetical protein